MTLYPLLSSQEEGVILDSLANTERNELQEGRKNDMKPFLNTSECAFVLGCSTVTVTRLCVAEKLKAMRVGRSWRVNARSFADYTGLTQEELTKALYEHTRSAA